jgi:uncharacterized membrane protein
VAAWGASGVAAPAERVQAGVGDAARNADQRNTGSAQGNDALASVVDRNLKALLIRRRAREKEQSREERMAGAITSFAGSMRFVYIHLAIFGTWILWNVGIFGLPPFDESLVALAMVASVEAIFLSTFVLISQNRMTAEADERAELDLQVGLLTEHEVTRLVTLVAAIARTLDLEEARDPEIPELEQDVLPEQVMDALQGVDDEAS